MSGEWGLSDKKFVRNWTYYAKVEPQPDGRWLATVWSGDPFWERSRGAFPASVAERLDLRPELVIRSFRSEQRARKGALRMVARCERRHAAKYDRDEFIVRPASPAGGTP